MNFTAITSEFPDIIFNAENHGVQVSLLLIAVRVWLTGIRMGLRQVFVHTLLATKVKLERVDVSWVTQLTADRLDIFSQARHREPTDLD